jgi:hypothetical protein
MNHESETTIRQATSLSQDTVRDWISMCKVKGKESRFIRVQIGKALEYKHPIALEFLKTAHEIDPDYIKTGFFRNFIDLL